MDLKSIEPPLRFTEGTKHIWDKLAQILRTGWVQWEIPEPENVAEHILAIRELAMEWRENILLKDEEFDDLLTIIEVHDWPEVIVGDLVIMGDERNFITLKNEKREKEKSAMEILCKDVPRGEEALLLYKRYEANVDDVARYAKQLDKVQAVLLAKEYGEKYDRPGLLEEFLNYSERSIDIPFLVSELDKIRITS